ncbi:MAG: hypothetical protein FRX48_07592 [Lasallia pustulata]|uniref:Uncharacterized protein n=1 Tax=Lasallia pustulata TaxID=136370 RepID=A0A5M8PHW2_9LECA|nr:MAG: hypothetical protein FRX48_07592 [Lasallia pustulata]
MTLNPQTPTTLGPQPPATFTPQALNARNFPPASLHLGSPIRGIPPPDVAIKPEAPEKPSQHPQPLWPKVDALVKEIESLKWQVHEVTVRKDYYQNLAQFYQEWAGKTVTRACQLTIESDIRQQEIQTAISRLQRLTLEVGNNVKEYGEKARDRHNEVGNL